MTRWALILLQLTKWFEGRNLCHLCGARLRTLLPHKCRIPPVPFPPVKKSWREYPPEKPPTQIKRICTNSLRKQFRDSLYKLSPFFTSKKNRKQTKEFAQTVCANSFYLGGWLFRVGRLPFKEVPDKVVFSLTSNSRRCGHQTGLTAYKF